jgi:hypothetical protein
MEADMAVPRNFNSSQPFGGAQASEPQAITAKEFLANPQPSYEFANNALLPQPYPDRMIGGTGTPILPSSATVLFDNPMLDDLPPISALFNRPRPVITSG